MATIDSLDISVHFEYARRAKSVENTLEMLHLEQAPSIPGHTKIYNLSPQLQGIEELFGFRKSVLPFASFSAPATFFEQRRSCFAFDRLCPSLGNQVDQEATLEAIKRSPLSETPILTTSRRFQKNQEEQSLLMKMMNEILHTNKLINFITSRVGQFLQG